MRTPEGTAPSTSTTGRTARPAWSATSPARRSTGPPTAPALRGCVPVAATGWIAGQTGHTLGVYLFDRVARKTSMVSHAPSSLTTLGNGDSYSPAIAAGGSRVVFLSQATDLVAGLADLNLRQDLFVCDVAPLDNHAVTLHPPTPPPSRRSPT